MEHKIISDTEAVLRRLGVICRKLPCSTGAFYYCKIPGYTFDLQVNDNVIRLWRFIGAVAVSNAGKRCEYRNPEFPHGVIGVEITEEGDACFYVEQKLNASSSNLESCISRIISGYVGFIRDVSFTRHILQTSGFWKLQPDEVQENQTEERRSNMEAFSRAVYPENYILFGSPYALEKDIDAIISNAKTRRPESFEGNKDSFVFEFRYIEPFDKNFKELKRLQGTAAEAAGRRYEFKGYIVIDLSAYLNHHEEDYMEKILFFLIDMSGFWKYIFLVDDQNPKAARELAGKVLMHFTLDNLPCRVIETKEKISAIEYINMTCKERNIRCSSSVKEFFQDLLKQNFSKEMVSALIMDISWQHGKLINEDILETALSNQNSLIYYMLTPKEFSRFRTFVEHRKEKWNGEKKEI